MSAELLLREFDRIADAPDAIARLRRLVLDLAVSGNLTEGHKPTREPAGPELPWSIPSDWNVTQFADLAGSTGVFVDGDWVESKDQDPGGDVRLTQLADVGVGAWRDRSARFMRSDVAEQLNCTYLEPGDVLIARMPDPIGRACLFPGDVRPCVTVVDVAVLRSGRSDIYPSFVVTALNSSRFSTLVQAKAAGTTRQRISRGNLGRLPFPLPPLAEQQRIVDGVDELMALCDRLESGQKERELQRDALRTVSLHRLTAPEDEPVDVRFFLAKAPRLITKAEHVTAVRQTILDLAVRGQLVPQEGPWQRTTLGDIGRWGSGGTPSTGNRDYYDGGIPWVVIGDLNEGTVVHTSQTITEAGLANSSAKMVEVGTVLIAMYGASVGKMGITGVRCATNQAIAHCVHDPDLVDRDYLFNLLRSLRAGLVASARGGAQPNISQTVLKGWSVALPPLAEQRCIVAKVDELMLVCDELEAVLASAQIERGRLLAALLREALEGAAVPILAGSVPR